MFNVIYGFIAEAAAIFRSMSVRRNNNGQFIIGSNLHKVRIGRNLLDRVTIKSAGIDIDGHIGGLEGLSGADEVRSGVEVWNMIKEADIERVT